jgi:hypothetical protein
MTLHRPEVPTPSDRGIAGGDRPARLTATVDPATGPPVRLLDRLREAIRLRHYSYRTEQAYVDWSRRFILFHGKRHPMELGAREVTHFLSHLANERHVSASTQAQARSALLFLYGQVLGVQLPWLDEVATARTPRKLPVVLTLGEVRQLLQGTSGVHGLVATLLYGTGMRLMEGLRLRVKDIEFERREVVVRDGKGGKDRLTVLPETSSCRCRGTWPGAAPGTRQRCRGLRVGAAGRAGDQVPGRRDRVGLAVDLRRRREVDGSALGRAPAAPPASAIGAARRLRGGASCGHRQAVFAARAEQGRTRCAQPAGRAVAGCQSPPATARRTSSPCWPSVGAANGLGPGVRP